MEIKVETIYGIVILRLCYDCDSSSNFYDAYDDNDHHLGELWDLPYYDEDDDESMECLKVALETAIDSNDICIPYDEEKEPKVHDSDDSITRQDVLDLFAENGWTIFGKFVDDVADAIADEVVEEYKEAGDGNLQKAVAYVILDKFDKLA